MKKHTLNTLIAALSIFAFALSSCSSDKGLSVTKRKYRNGYHVEWHGNKKMKEQAQVTTTEDVQLMDLQPVSSPEAALNSTPADYSGSNVEMTINNKETVTAPATIENVNSTTLSKAEYRKERKELRRSLKHELKSSSSAVGEEMPQWLVILLAIIIPPLAVGLVLGVHTEFWISLILTLLMWLPGAIYALVILL
jgi:uncharacterized membrane protein YqaE (UPF0057 family)